MKIPGYHEGDRSEIFGQAAFSTIGHCVPVPRQADQFGVDMYLQLFEETGRTLSSTGMGCAIQLKSTTDDIEIDSDEKRLALHGMAYPFFIAVIDKSAGTLSVYSTLMRLVAYWSWPTSNYRVTMGGPYSFTVSDKSVGTKVISCSEPIVRLAIADLDATDKKAAARRTFREILEYWITIETDAIAWKASYIPMVPIVKYETNERPTSVPNLVLVARQEHSRGMVQSLESSLFAVSRCTDMMSKNTDYEFSADQRLALTQLSEESHAFAFRVSDLSSRVPNEGQRPVRMSYIVD